MLGYVNITLSACRASGKAGTEKCRNEGIDSMLMDLFRDFNRRKQF